MLQVNLLSQRSEVWRYYKLGFGTGTIGSYGCLLVSYTMLLNYLTKRNFTPLEVNDAMKAAGGYTGETKNLWIWAKADEIYPTKYTVNHSGSYVDSEVKKWLEKGVPVIIKVDGKPIGGLSHYVLAIGDGQIADPWTGTIRPFSTYTPLGYHVYTYTGQEPMSDLTDQQLADLKTDSNNWKFLCQKYDISDPQQVVGKIEEYEGKIASLTKQLADVQKQLSEKQIYLDKANIVVAEMDKIGKAYGVLDFDGVDKIIRTLKEEIAATQNGTTQDEVPEPISDTSSGDVTITVKKGLVEKILDFIKTWFTINQER